jgi:hypothetical protein
VMTTAQVALVVSIVGALLASASLGWNVTTFLRSGARVKVTLSVRGIGPRQSSSSISIKDWRSDNAWRNRPFQHLEVRATNGGRSPTWVEGVGLVCAKMSIGFNVAVKGDDSSRGEEFERAMQGLWGPHLPYKLDAGQSVTWALAVPLASVFWEVADATDRDGVRGQVELGKGDKLRSREEARVRLLRDSTASFQSGAEPDILTGGSYTVNGTVSWGAPSIGSATVAGEGFPEDPGQPTTKEADAASQPRPDDQ